MREAEARLRSLGFKIGPHELIEGEKDWVYGVKYNGRMVYAGDRLPVDSRIILQVGSGNMEDYSDSLDIIDSLGIYTDMPVSSDAESNDPADFEF